MSVSSAAVRPHGFARRLASSIWLPWGVGAALLVLLAVVSLVAGGRVDSGVRVPPGVIDMQQSATSTAAQGVRRSLNEGIDDLTAAGTALSEQGVTDTAHLQEHLASLVALHRRYGALYVVDQTSAVVAHVGSAPHQGLLPVDVSEPGMTDAAEVDGTEVILQHSPLIGPNGNTWVLVGEYDPAFLQYSLESLVPASAWVVNEGGRVVGSTIGYAPLQQLDRRILRAAAVTAGGDTGYAVGGGSLDARELVAWAPTAGSGPAGTLGWGVVSARSLDTMALPHTQAREQALLFGVLLLVLSVGVFGWLYLMLLRPFQRLQQEAERVAYGDLRHPVEIRRYDEIGLTGRSLERIRLLLIRRRVQEPAGVGVDSEHR